MCCTARLGTSAKAISFMLLAAMGIVFSEKPGSASERPNILFIMTDDQGYWDTGVSGNPHIDTPHMDSLARDGVQLRRYYAAPVCAPTRAGVMTGRYYLRTGLYNTRFGGDSMGLDEVTVAELLKKAGYRTGLFGKWHLGKYPGYQPQERGFDEFFGHYHGHIERYDFPDQVYHNGRPAEARGYVSDLFTDASIDFIESTVEAGDAPFFCALMFNAPHSPWLLDTSHTNQESGDALLVKYLKRGLPIREARIYALIQRVDRNIGRLLRKLDEFGLAENTLVVFVSDNGGVSKYWQGEMRGNKASVYEGGVRTPCYVRWSGTVPSGGVITGQASHVDWLPTFCELADVETPQDRTIDGRSLVSLLKAGRGEAHQPYVYHTWDRYFPSPDRRWGISDQRWKLLGQFRADDPPSQTLWKLFDLEADPGEENDKKLEHPEVVARLRAEFERWFADVTDGVRYEPIRIPVALGNRDSVEIEPSWGTWEGPFVEYTFDGYDWDTIDHWKEPGERVTWRLEVEQSGRYAVVLTYGCRPLDAGGMLRVSAGESHVDHQVKATATAEQFEAFDVGELSMRQGPVTLTTEVVAAPGRELMRLNRIRLTRIE